MNRVIYRGLFFVLGTAVFMSCGQKKGPVVAKVGSQTITANELRQRLEETPAAYRPYAQSPEGRKEFLNLLIREKILLNEARRQGFHREAAYRDAVGKFKEEQAERLTQYRDTLLIESFLRKLRSKDLAVSDTDVQKYYDDHKRDFDNPVELQVSQIMVSTPQEAALALERLKKEPFEKVAQEMSKDPTTAARGGKMLPFRRGSLLPEFDDVAYSLAPGALSTPVQTQFGFHIIKKTAQRTLPSQRFVDVKEDIRRRMERDKFDAWVKAKQAVLGVHTNEENMQ